MKISREILKRMFGPTKGDFQIAREIRWLFHNFAQAETEEVKAKWEQKIHNWEKAHPRQAESVQKQLVDMVVNLAMEGDPDARAVLAEIIGVETAE